MKKYITAASEKISAAGVGRLARPRSALALPDGSRISGAT
jgi:hypothetical protein